MSRVILSGKLKSLLRTPLLMTALLVVVAGVVYMLHPLSGILMAAAVIVYFAVILWMYRRTSSGILNEMITFASQYGQVQRHLLQDLDVPFAVTDDHGRLLWTNDAFQKLAGPSKKNFNRSIASVFGSLSVDRFPEQGQEREIETVREGRIYRVRVKNLVMDELVEQSQIMTRVEDESVSVFSFFLYDITDLREYMQKFKDETMVCGLIYLDNYDEALESVEEVRRSLLTALIDRKINKYFQDLDAVVRKFEKDKYIVMMRSSTLAELKSQKFGILSDVKTVNIGNDMAVTMSIGIGANNGTYNKNADSARMAIDLALGRGGDQVVIRDGESISYFGGKSQAVEKSTRVKARVKAHALQEFIESKEKVVVMGHQLMDIDAFGAAVGIYRASRTLNRRAYIVVDRPTTSTAPFIEQFRNNPDYEQHMLVTVDEAKEMVDPDTLLVVVDTNKPDYTECEELLSQTSAIVVLDHHRTGNNYIRNSVLSYIEPYASSACEMVAEILQYFEEGVKLRNIEADTLYAGMIVDTNSFIQRTGVRTFEAAAYLRRCGADVTRVRKMFREDVRDYQAKGEALRSAEMFRDSFILAVCPSEGLESPTIVGSQVANQLLDIKGVKASFVLTAYNDVIYISARAIDEVNVQIIMERMGGGGHLNMAGTQLHYVTIEEAKQRLKDLIGQMLDDGEI